MIKFKVILTLLFLFTQNIYSKHSVIDLRDIDTLKVNTHPLNGTWDYYQNIFTDPAFLPDAFTTIDVPGGWSGKGYSMFSIRLILPELWRNKELALYFEQINSAGMVWINNSLKEIIGRPSSLESSSSPEFKEIFIPFFSNSYEVTIHVLVSNFELGRGGIILTPHIGPRINIERKYLSKMIIHILLIGAFLIMAIYHLVLYFLRKSDRSRLYFSIITIIIALRIILDQPVIYELVSNYSLLVNLNRVGFYILIPFFLLYLQNIFPKDFYNKIKVASILIAFIATILTVFMPIYFGSKYTLPIYQALGVIFILYSSVILFISIINKRDDVKIFFMGFVIIIITGINDILFYTNLMDTFPVFPLGLIIFMFFQATILAIRYNRAFIENELLNNSLEVEVQKRTRDLNQALKALEDISLRDHLTGLRNRRFVHEVVEKEANCLISRANYNIKNMEKRVFNFSQNSYSILLLDLDFFKKINDEYGHEAGDRILIQFTQILVKTLREDDVTVRWGGEEFLVILKNINLESTKKVAEKIRKTVDDFGFSPFESGDLIINLTTSIGIAPLPFLGDKPFLIDLNHIIKFADFALYQAKAGGRNCCIVAIPGENVTGDEPKEIWDGSAESWKDLGLIRFENT